MEKEPHIPVQLTEKPINIDGQSEHTPFEAIDNVNQEINNLSKEITSYEGKLEYCKRHLSMEGPEHTAKWTKMIEEFEGEIEAKRNLMKAYEEVALTGEAIKNEYASFIFKGKDNKPGMMS